MGGAVPVHATIARIETEPMREGSVRRMAAMLPVTGGSLAVSDASRADPVHHLVDDARREVFGELVAAH